MALARVSHTHLPAAFWVPTPPPWARGTRVSATTAGTCALGTSPASQSHGICYIYTPSLDGEVDAQCLARGERRTLGPAVPLPPPPCPESPALLAPLAQAVSLLQSVRESSVWGSGRGAALPLPERRARAEGLASRCCRARRGLVGRLPVHPEAIDAGVLGVAPVSQDPQLHHLVRGHGRVLGRERRRQACRSPQTWRQVGGAMPPLGPDVPLPGSLQRTGSKAPVCSPRRRASSWWARQPQRLQTSFWGHPPSTT